VERKLKLGYAGGGVKRREEREMSYAIEEIEGIGKVFAEKLRAAGIRTTADYLERAKDRKGRKSLADELKIDEARILKWANHCDLFRIHGVASQMAELLEAAGVDTVKELANRVPANLAAKMATINETKKLVRQVPGESVVARWVEQAKGLDAMMSH
jgi:predicted flap endonuclease-1-like 5' DNA nuclease